MRLRINQELHDALLMFGLLPDFSAMVSTPVDYNSAVQCLSQFKTVAKQRRKELALEHHPDRGGNAEKMKEINRSLELIEKLNVRRPQPVQTFKIVHVTTSWSSNYWTASSNSTTSTGGW